MPRVVILDIELGNISMEEECVTPDRDAVGKVREVELLQRCSVSEYVAAFAFMETLEAFVAATESSGGKGECFLPETHGLTMTRPCSRGADRVMWHAQPAPARR